jgi:hypothetical protein
VRNVAGLWHSDGRAHHELQVLGEQRREPATPFYHLRYVATSEAERLATAERYERLVPDLRTEAYPVNALYLPERWSGVRTAAVPERDRGLIAAVAEPPPAPAGAAARVEPVTLADVERFNAGRAAGSLAAP